MSTEQISPRRSFPLSDPQLTIARVSQGLTIYTRETRTWAERGALLLFRAFRARVPDWRVRWFMTSRHAKWYELTEGGGDEIESHLSVSTIDGRVRHLFEVAVADVPGSCHAGFVYREVDDGRGGATGYAQVFLPRQTDPGELLSLAIEVGHELPFTAAIGGYVGTYSRPHLREAFIHFDGLARRHLGLDLQVPWVAARHVRRGLPSVGWITMVGHEHRDALSFDLSRLEGERGVALMHLTRGTLIRAGELTLGDVNLMEYPSELARVAIALDPYLLRDEPRYPGPFEDEGRTEAWRRRFAFPESWS